LQRFLSEDPLEFGGGDTNLYTYVANNATNDIDPTGEGFIDCGKALAELARAEGELLRRMAERAAAQRPDYGHNKAIDQAKKRLRNALDKAKHCLSPEEIERYLKILAGTLIVAGAAGIAATAPELLPLLPPLVRVIIR